MSRDEAAAAAAIEAVLEREGPRTGAELRAATGLELFTLWRLCHALDAVIWSVVGRRYLRLDRAVEGYGRLSPSIKREFLTYTVLGTTAGAAERQARARALGEEIRRISREKECIARVSAGNLLDALEGGERLRDEICFILAGDIVHGMAHAVPRPEKSTGKMVRGSDLDVVIVHPDTTPAESLARLDRAMLAEKYRLLSHASYREEIDYVIKPVARVREQLGFETFEHMVAAKILDEGVFLQGSHARFAEVKGLVQSAGIPARLARLEARAVEYREEGERLLLECETEPPREVLQQHFYTKEEDPEIY